ncbi:L-proline trans-4-hydroxylase-like [Ruditapes philippinarum]|uniref:L-proline trans-4-hydroxylase-like n=1 Tax=Ruditapes philippinarum TaxID=129788 RepID=UPI00295B0129|nr:L-proline trans-4-hydroxylase-like [Ruditapes philippinarum]
MEVVYDEEDYDVTTEMKNAFLKQGYIIVRKLFRSEEIQQMIRNYEEGKAYHQYEFFVKDCDDKSTIQTTWNYPGNDVFGMAAKTQKMVETCSQLLGGEVYHYHSKIVIKPPKTGGQRCWHQDYGSWYNFVPFPELITAFIAIDPVNKENGCLQVLEGSQTAGKIEHTLTGGEIGADINLVQELHNFCPLKYIEQEPGDVIFLHCNTLYKSDVNTSDERRMAFLPVYNRKSNSPVKEGIHPGYSPLDVVYNDAVLDCENFTDLDGKGFIDTSDPECLKTIVNLDSSDALKDTVYNT